jgi:hypothetical protein
MAGAWMGGSQWGRPVAYGVVAGTLGDSKTAYPAQQHGSRVSEPTRVDAVPIELRGAALRPRTRETTGKRGLGADRTEAQWCTRPSPEAKQVARGY